MTGPALDEVQAWMQHALIHPGQGSQHNTELLLEPSPRLAPQDRLAIYQRGYYARILECMTEQFPALCHALGEGLFRDFARQYLEAMPPVSYTLYDLGRRFPGYLEDTRPDRDEPEAWVDFMVDLARFERQLFVLFDAPGNEGEPFATVDTPDDRLRLQPCFALGDYRFPVAWYYHQVRLGYEPALPQAARSPVALARKDYLTHTYLVTPPQHTFLAALQRGAGVAAALAAVAAETGRDVADTHAAWAEHGGPRGRWIEAGFFVAAG